jgi:Lrp/AsnC family transcriptional regulator for asnA, asnC and gidA
MPYDLDLIDKGILTFLQENSKTPYAEMSKLLDVSLGTIHTRIKKMERCGVIEKMDVKINYGKLGFQLIVFMFISLDKNSNYDKALLQLEKIQEITEIHYTTGKISMLVKLVLKDNQHLREILHDKIQKIEEIQKIETLLSLKQSLSRKIVI